MRVKDCERCKQTFYRDNSSATRGIRVFLGDQHKPLLRGRRRKAKDLAVSRPWLQSLPSKYVQGAFSPLNNNISR